jgi:hypothetical protein
MPAGRRRETAATSVPPLGGLEVKPGAVTETLSGTPDPLRARCAGAMEMATYLVLSSFTGQPVKRSAAKPGPGCRCQPLGGGCSIPADLGDHDPHRGQCPRRRASGRRSCSRMSAARCSRMPVTHCELWL